MSNSDLVHLFASQSALECLPAELRITILQQCFDIPSVLALIGASPAYLQAFLSARQELLTLTTLRELKERARGKSKFSEFYLPSE